MTVTDRAATEWPREPRLRFAADAWRRLAGYVTNCEPEISGMGFIEEDSTGDLIVTRVLILQQEADELETTLDGAAVSALLAECIERGLDVAGLRLWWHSHAGEEVFWSPGDEYTIDQFRNDNMISVVLNHELHLLARCDRYAPRSTLWVHPEPPACEPLDDAELARLRAEITAKVHPRAPRSGGVLRLPAPGAVT